ncbi:MAG: prepilin-type N-terminal cleavage/methylation domain-containing protein [Phycisphaerales bacterium]
MPRCGLTLLEVLVAAALLAAVGAAAVSVLRSLADADRHRRMLALAPMVMAVANAEFDRAWSSERSSSDGAADPIGEITGSSIEVEGVVWIVEIAPVEPVHDTIPNPDGPVAAGGDFAVTVLRFAARPGGATESHDPIVWWRAIPTTRPVADTEEGETQ